MTLHILWLRTELGSNYLGTNEGSILNFYRSDGFSILFSLGEGFFAFQKVLSNDELLLLLGQKINFSKDQKVAAIDRLASSELSHYLKYDLLLGRTPLYSRKFGLYVQGPRIRSTMGIVVTVFALQDDMPQIFHLFSCLKTHMRRMVCAVHKTRASFFSTIRMLVLI